MDGLSVLPAVELLSMLRRGQISPLELADEHIAQIERFNPGLNALVDFEPERVRAQARLLQESPTPRGPLFGLPMTVKSSIATAGTGAKPVACCTEAISLGKMQPWLSEPSRRVP